MKKFFKEYGYETIIATGFALILTVIALAVLGIRNIANQYYTDFVGFVIELREELNGPVIKNTGMVRFCDEQGAASKSKDTSPAQETEPVPGTEQVDENTADIPADILVTDQAAKYFALSESDRVTIHTICMEHNIDESIVLAICYNETRFNPELTHVNANGTTDWGIAQCNDAVFGILSEKMGISSMSELLNLANGVEACCTLLAYYGEQYGLHNFDALLAYQEGIGNYYAVVNGEQQPWDAFEQVKSHATIFSQIIAAEQPIFDLPEDNIVQDSNNYADNAA